MTIHTAPAPSNTAPGGPVTWPGLLLMGGLTLVLHEPVIRLAAWGLLWGCHILAGYPEPPSYSAWMPGL